MSKAGNRYRKDHTDPQRPASADAAMSLRLSNSLLRDALMQALGRSQRSAMPAEYQPAVEVMRETARRTSGPSSVADVSRRPLSGKRHKRIEIIVPPETDPRKLASRAKAAARQRTADKVATGRPKVPTKRQATAKKLTKKKRAIQDRVEAAEARWLRDEGARARARDKAVQGAAHARLAHNAAVKAQATNAQGDSKQPEAQTFDRLLREWRRAVEYVFRAAGVAANAPDVLDAQARVNAIEQEWLRLAGLPPDHPDYFKWPSTEAPLGAGGMDFGGWEAMGMLAYIGYKVGMGSVLSDDQRQGLLLRIFAMHLPPLNGPSYLREWAVAGTPSRLRKMAESIASLARNAKRRRNTSLQTAISHWEADLHFLRKHLYVGKFGFGWTWPVT